MLMMAYPSLTPRIIDEELTPRQIKGMFECWEEQPPAALQLHKLNCQIEGIISAFTGNKTANNKSNPECVEFEWSKFGAVEELWDGM